MKVARNTHEHVPFWTYVRCVTSDRKVWKRVRLFRATFHDEKPDDDKDENDYSDGNLSTFHITIT